MLQLKKIIYAKNFTLKKKYKYKKYEGNPQKKASSRKRKRCELVVVQQITAEAKESGFIDALLLNYS